MVCGRPTHKKLPRAFVERLTDALCYTVSMAKVKAFYELGEYAVSQSLRRAPLVCRGYWLLDPGHREPSPSASRTLHPLAGAGSARPSLILLFALRRETLLPSPYCEGIPFDLVRRRPGCRQCCCQKRFLSPRLGSAPNGHSCPMISMPLILCPYLLEVDVLDWGRSLPSIH